MIQLDEPVLREHYAHILDPVSYTHLPEEVRYAPYQSPQHGPERKDVGGKGDKDVVFVRLDVPSVQIRFESCLLYTSRCV